LAALALLSLLGMAGGPAMALTAPAPGSVAGLPAAAVAVAGCVVAAWWATRRRDREAAYALTATACLWGGAAGARLAVWWELPAGPALALAVAGVLAAAAAARLVTRHAAGHLAAAAVLAAVAAAPAVGAASQAGVRAAAPLLVLAIGIVPRLALTAGGLGLADYRVRHGGQLPPAAVAERLRRSEVLLTGTLAGVAVAAAGLGLVLVTAPGAWDRWLGALIGLTLLLRSRVFSGLTHVIPIRVAGALVLAVQLGWLANQSPAISGWLPALAVAALLGMVSVSAVALSDISRARVKQLLDAAEVVAVAAMLPVAAGALGWYRFAAGIIG
jgi:hypothetical protein